MGLKKSKYFFLFFISFLLVSCANDKENEDNKKLSADCFSYFTIKKEYELCFPTENMFCNTKNNFQDESFICKNKFKNYINDKININKQYIDNKFNKIIKKYNLSNNGQKNVKNSILKKMKEHYEEINNFDHSLLRLQVLFEQYNVNCHTDKNIHRCGDSKNSINKFYVEYINKTHFLEKNTDIIFKETQSILNTQ